MEEMIKSAQIKILLHPQFKHKQEPAEDQSEGGRPRDGGHSQPHTGDNSITDLILMSCWDVWLISVLIQEEESSLQKLNLSDCKLKTDINNVINALGSNQCLQVMTMIEIVMMIMMKKVTMIMGHNILGTILPDKASKK